MVVMMMKVVCDDDACQMIYNDGKIEQVEIYGMMG